MKTRARTLGLAVLGFSCLAAAPAVADDALATTLRGVVTQNLGAYDGEDAAGTLRSIHTGSPDYAATKEALPSQFEELDVTPELVEFVFIGHDDEFALARVKTRTTGKPGSGFTDNTVDAIVVFHQEDDTWKLWSEEVLGVQISAE